LATSRPAKNISQNNPVVCRAWKKKEEGEDGEDATKYRDRAKERQKDANPDYNAEDVKLANAFHAEAPAG